VEQFGFTEQDSPKKGVYSSLGLTLACFFTCNCLSKTDKQSHGLSGVTFDAPDRKTGN